MKKNTNICWDRWYIHILDYKLLYLNGVCHVGFVFVLDRLKMKNY